MRWLLVAVLATACAVADEDEIAALERQISELERELEGCQECQTELARIQYELMLCENMEVED